MPAACPMRWSTEGYHGHSRPTPQTWRPGLTHVSRAAEEPKKRSLKKRTEPIVVSMPLSDDAKNKYIAPGMSAFTTATIEDMSETSAEQKYWVGNFLLNSIFRVRVDGPTKPALLNFLRRADAAFQEYSLARSRTLAYLASPNVVMEYLTAITHWEVSSPRHIKPTAFSTCAREASSGSATAPFSNA